MGDLPPKANAPGVKSMFSFLLNSSGELWIIANFGDSTKFDFLPTLICSLI